MLAKTDKGKKIRSYYVKLENINNKILKQQMEETNQKLIEKNNELKQNTKLLKAKDLKIMEMKRRKLTKYEKLESVYIGTDNDERSKIGNTKDQNTRESTYKVNNPNFKIFYIIPCNNYLLIERIIKHILNKHTLHNYYEWFNISCDKLKVILETIINIIDDTLKYDNIDELYNIFSQLHNTLNKIEPTFEQEVIQTIEKVEKLDNVHLIIRYIKIL